MQISRVNFLLSLVSFYFIIGLSSCHQNKLSSSYVVRNKIVEHEAGMRDSIQVKQFLISFDRRNRSYFEIAKYKIKGTNGILFTSDLYHNSARLGIYDEYEKVNYFVLDSNQVNSLIQFSNTVVPNVQKKKTSFRVDYSLSKDVFISLIKGTSFNEGPVIPYIKEISIWMYGRRIDLKPNKFIKALKALK